jgi:hypothetical protein
VDVGQEPAVLVHPLPVELEADPTAGELPFGEGGGLHSVGLDPLGGVHRLRRIDTDEADLLDTVYGGEISTVSPSMTLLTATVTPPAGAFPYVAGARSGRGFGRGLGRGAGFGSGLGWGFAADPVSFVAGFAASPRCAPRSRALPGAEGAVLRVSSVEGLRAFCGSECESGADPRRSSEPLLGAPPGAPEQPVEVTRTMHARMTSACMTVVVAAVRSPTRRMVLPSFLPIRTLPA